MSTAPAATPLERPWHSCQDCQHCDGTTDRPCTWSAFNEGRGHQDAACYPRCHTATKRAGRKRSKRPTVPDAGQP